MATYWILPALKLKTGRGASRMQKSLSENRRILHAAENKIKKDSQPYLCFA
jgi:hypothetical protein